MTQEERMLAGLPYIAGLEELAEKQMECKKKLYELNNLGPEQMERKYSLLKDIIGKTEQYFIIETPFHCDYGKNIEVGEFFFANYNFTVLDVAKVTIGNNAHIGPNVSLYTSGHPIHPDSRNSGYSYGIPITIGNNVWIGGSTVILPGVTIGDNVVIGAGSVVTKDIPENMIAVGNPCKVIREITEADRDYYYKDKKFDVDDYK